jgi:hypothetical protein
MKHTETLQLHDLLEEIKRLDKLIVLHGDDTFMSTQYVNLQHEIFTEFANRLTDPDTLSPLSIRILKKAIEIFYSTPKVKRMQSKSLDETDLKSLEGALG